MNKKLILFIISSIILASCTKTKIEIDEPKQQLEGYLYATYDNIQLQHPNNWQKYDSTNPEQLEIVLQDEQANDETIKAILNQLDSLDTLWYDFDDSSDDYNTNISYYHIDSPGVNIESFTDESFLADFTEEITKQSKELYNEDEYEFIQKPTIKQLGDNFFVIYEIAITQETFKLNIYKAVCLLNEVTHHFTMTSAQEENINAQFETVLASVEIVPNKDN